MDQFLTMNALGIMRPSGLPEEVEGLVMTRPLYYMTEEEPPSRLQACTAP